MISVTVCHIIMALPLFVVSTADSEGVLSVVTIGTIELVTTHLTKHSKTAFAT
jgi:hypothetical protein